MSKPEEPTPAERFADAMRYIMSVPKSEVEKRAKTYRRQRQRNKRKKR